MVRGLHDMRGQVPGGLVTRWIAHHLERDHGAQPAHVANNAAAPRPGFEARAHAPADIPRPRRVVVPPHDLDRGQRRGAGQRIAAIGSAQSAHRGRVHQIRAPDQRRDRQAGAHGLGQGVEIGLHPGVLGGEPLAAAAKARLNLIGDQHDAVPTAVFAQRLQKGRWRHMETALSWMGSMITAATCPGVISDSTRRRNCSKAARAQASSVRPER